MGLSLKIQLCFPLQDQDPFGFGLAVPEIQGAGVPGGDYALNGQARGLQQGDKLLGFCSRSREVIEQIGKKGVLWQSDTLLEAGLDEGIQISIQHALGIAYLVVGTQVLDAGLVENIGANLVAPADI